MRKRFGRTIAMASGLSLVALLGFAGHLFGLGPSASASSNPVETAIAWAMSHNGQYYDYEKCQTFVHDAYAAAGIQIGYPPGPAFHAKDYYFQQPQANRHDHDTNPPRGALVYWDATPARGSIPANPDGHVGISLGDGQVISTYERSNSNVHIFSIAARNAAGYPYLGWVSPPGVNLANTAAVPESEYLGHIVQWSGDTNPQRTAWLVVLDNGVVRRRWIPDIPTYWCLKNNGHSPGPDVLSSTTLNAMPDEVGTWASCDMAQKGGAGGDAVPASSGTSEQAGHNGSRTFSDYHTASGVGPSVGPGQYVSVGCKVLDGNIASSNPDGYWYQLVGEPWNGNYWAPANVFMNGDPWNGPYTHNTDMSVPDCGKSGSGSTSSPAGVTTFLEQEGHHGANTFTDYHSASGNGTPISSGQYVSVSCKVLDTTIASANPDGYWYRLAGSPWNDNYYAAANTFMNGDPWNGPYSHNTDFNVPDCATSTATAPPPAATTYSELEGHHGVHTFSDVHNASGLGPDIAPGATIQVSCRVLDGTIASVNPDGYWYRIYSAPWNNAYYAPANTFMNGDPWNGPYTHNTDFNVPVCGSNPPPPPTTYAEQEGHHGVNTFTDYHNASGQGQAIAAFQTVNVTCKVYDPTIASVNPDGYWYRIADSPWNDTYYAPANTFFNGDPINGPYTHNTDFNVPNC